MFGTVLRQCTACPTAARGWAGKDDVAMAVQLTLEKGLRGVFNVAGGERHRREPALLITDSLILIAALMIVQPCPSNCSANSTITKMKC